jgi:molybdopterin molybdotransferase
VQALIDRAYNPAMLQVAEALEILLDAARPLASEEVDLVAALGRVLADPVAADRDFPPADRSAMDGFAVRAADTAAAGPTLRVTGELPAGRSAEGVTVNAGEAIRIFTGGVIPRGADAVVMVELTEEDRASRTVRVLEPTPRGQHIRRRGEDLTAGEIVLAAGALVGPAEIAALAAVGRARIDVIRPPRVAVISTGDEIVDIEESPAPHQVRNSNGRMLIAQLAAMGFASTDLGIVTDDPDRLDEAIERGLSGDVLVLTGGVSVGEYDLVGGALARAGCEVLFHKVAMRPGKPILAARRGGCLVLGLPGNPVSAFTGFHVFVAPALRRLMGHPEPVEAPIRATLLDRVHRKPGRLTYQLARLSWRDGRPVAAPVRSASSGDVLSLARANAFIVVPGGMEAVEAGTEVDVAPWGV